MSSGRWIVRTHIVRTHTGKKIVEKQTKFEATSQKCKRKPPRGEERLKWLINENFGNNAVVKVTYETDSKKLEKSGRDDCV